LDPINIIFIISRLLEFAPICFYRRVFEKCMYCYPGITYTPYYIMGRKQTTPLR